MMYTGCIDITPKMAYSFASEVYYWLRDHGGLSNGTYEVRFDRIKFNYCDTFRGFNRQDFGNLLGGLMDVLASKGHVANGSVHCMPYEDMDDGGYVIENNKVQAMDRKEIAVRDSSDEVLLAELRRRGYTTHSKDKPAARSGMRRPGLPPRPARLMVSYFGQSNTGCFVEMTAMPSSSPATT